MWPCSKAIPFAAGPDANWRDMRDDSPEGRSVVLAGGGRGEAMHHHGPALAPAVGPKIAPAWQGNEGTPEGHKGEASSRAGGGET